MAEDSSFARVEALSEIASQFSASADKAGLITAAKAKVATLEDEEKSNGELYVKLMEKAVEKVRTSNLY